MTITHESELLTLAEATALLKVSRSTLLRWTKAGRVHGYRVGPKSLRWRKDDLLALVVPADGTKVAERDESPAAPRLRFAGPDDIWTDDDAEKLRRAIDEVAGIISPEEADEWVAALYRARQEGTRPADRPSWPT